MAVLAGPLPYALGASFGAVLHLLLFRFGEWDLAGPGLIFYFTSLNALVTGVLLFLGEAGSLQQAFLLATALVSSIVAGIFTSMVVYRVFFHRLRRFPGPFMAQFTNFYATYLSVRRAHLYEEIQALHAKYGDIVRVGMCTPLPVLTRRNAEHSRKDQLSFPSMTQRLFISFTPRSLPAEKGHFTL